jgi:Fe-S-cluster formation regulator IscX/YfhJ
MKRIPILIIVFVLIVNFFAGFIIIFNLMTPYIEEENTQSFENNPDPDYEVLAFTENHAHFLTLRTLEDFKRQNPGYSFLVPKGQEKFFTEELNHQNKGMIFDIKVEQISENRQLLTLSSEDFRSIVKNTYEATNKEVFPKTSMFVNMRETPMKLLVSAIGGAVICFISYFIFRKYRLI